VYFDAVVVSASMQVIYNNTPDAVRSFLENLTDEFPQVTRTYSVCAGRTMKLYSVEDYLALTTA
jgi:hypothetical protein